MDKTLLNITEIVFNKEVNTTEKINFVKDVKNIITLFEQNEHNKYFDYELNKYLTDLISSFNYKSNVYYDLFEMSVNYTNKESLKIALDVFNKLILKKGYRIRKIKERHMEGYPEPDGYKDLVITKLGYSESVSEKIYYWWQGYQRYQRY